MQRTPSLGIGRGIIRTPIRLDAGKMTTPLAGQNPEEQLGAVSLDQIKDENDSLHEVEGEWGEVARLGLAVGVRPGASLARFVQDELDRRQKKEEAQTKLAIEEEEARLRLEEARLRQEEARLKLAREEEEIVQRQRLATLQEEKLRAEIARAEATPDTSRVVEPVRIKIPPFDEEKEELDTFLGRFNGLQP